jgi:hypothetical protein
MGHRTNKVELKKQAIAEVAELMQKYTEYVESVKDKPFTTELREQPPVQGEHHPLVPARIGERVLRELKERA